VISLVIVLTLYNNKSSFHSKVLNKGALMAASTLTFVVTSVLEYFTKSPILALVFVFSNLYHI